MPTNTKNVSKIWIRLHLSEILLCDQDVIKIRRGTKRDRLKDVRKRGEGSLGSVGGGLF